ncbi:hypothetical protein BGX34_002101 [Mortierella sp. NVP85]|nr:hypothetical protein BGX34_002101 [Mortierella sp. NVP85]
MAPPSSAPHSKPETYDTLQYGQEPPQNHIKEMLACSHASSQETTENQEEQPRQPGPMKASKGMAAEQTPEQLSHMDSLERKDVKPFNRGKRGNRERSLLETTVIFTTIYIVFRIELILTPTRAHDEEDVAARGTEKALSFSRV